MEAIEKRVEKLENEMKKLIAIVEKDIKPEKRIREVDKSKNYISYSGNYKTEHAEATFAGDQRVEDMLFKMEDQADIFASLGNPERLKVIEILLGGAKSVKELMKEAGFKTTGQAYHHLNDLMGTRLVYKKEDKYVFEGSKVSAVVLMMTGAKLIYNNN